MQFPIMFSGRAIFEDESFEYKYNKDGLWIKKYLVSGDKKILLERRVFQ